MKAAHVDGAAEAGLHQDLVAVLHDLALEQVHRADEFSDEAAARELVDGGRGIHLHDLTGVHDGDPGGHGHGLFLIVGHGHEGDAEAFLEVDQLELGVLAQALVERPERLVQQQQLGMLGEAARQRHALALTAGELIGPALAQLGDLEQIEHLADPLGAFLARHAVLFEPELHVLLHGHVREQGVGLEHHVDGAGIGRDVGDIDPVDVDPPAGGMLQSRQQAQQGRFAAAGAAQEREELALEDVQAHVVDRIDIAEFLGDALDAHIGRRLGILPGFQLAPFGGDGHGRRLLRGCPDRRCSPQRSALSRRPISGWLEPGPEAVHRAFRVAGLCRDEEALLDLGGGVDARVVAHRLVQQGRRRQIGVGVIDDSWMPPQSPPDRAGRR